MSLRRIALLLALPGVALAVLGLVIGPDTSWFGIEGAYFTRDTGTPAYAGAFDSWASEPHLLSLHDGNLFLGAGIALCAAALLALVAGLRGFRLVRER